MLCIWLFVRFLCMFFQSFQFHIDSLVDAIGRAIAKQEEMDGAHVVDTTEFFAEDKLDYATLRSEAESLWKTLVATENGMNEDMARRIAKRVEMIFGRPMKISEITEDQTDLLNLVVIEMRELAQ